MSDMRKYLSYEWQTVTQVCELMAKDIGIALPPQVALRVLRNNYKDMLVSPDEKSVRLQAQPPLE